MDDFLKEKFENFSPAPPEHIWAGIEKGLERKPLAVLFFNNWKTISAAMLVLLLLSFGTWYFLPNDTLVAEENPPALVNPESIVLEQDIINTETSAIINNNNLATETQTETAINKETLAEKEIADAFIFDNNIQPISETAIAQSQGVNTPSLPTITSLSEIGSYTEISGFNSMQTANIGLSIPMDLSIKQKEKTNFIPETSPKTSSKGSWEMGFYFSPEVIFKDFDSVRMLNVYSFNIEPIYYFNNNWFLRFGLGMSFMRDRGFASLEYISNELMGSYEDVYDVTFDTINGKLTPTYYTETTEVWDSIRRLSVTEATNKYMYLQTPFLFGYTKKSPHFNWSFYAGPAVNFLVYEQTEMPVGNDGNITIIDLENRLPGRSPYFFQLWVGAGVEYKAGKHLSLALEPNYRYYFSGVYESSPYKTGFSSFALRLGVIYKIF